MKGGGIIARFPTYILKKCPPWNAAVDSFCVDMLDRQCCKALSVKTGWREGGLVARRGGSGSIIGAIEFTSWLGGTYISRVVTAEKFRGKGGVGTALIKHAVSSTSPSRVAFLNTFTFQAPEYYPRIGFKEEHVLRGWFHGWENIYFSKVIGEGESLGEAPGTQYPLRSSGNGKGEESGSFFTVEEVGEGEEGQSKFHDFLRVEMEKHQQKATNIVDKSFRCFYVEAVAVKDAPPLALDGASSLPGDPSPLPQSRVGACTAMTYWGALVITHLQVDETFEEWVPVRDTLLEHTIKCATTEGCNFLLVEVMDFDVNLLSFVEEKGFRRVGAVKGFSEGREMVRLVLDLK